MMRSSRAARSAAFVLAVILALGGLALGGAVASGASDLVLILDASGSMWGQIEGENKIVIAREVLGSVIDGLPDDQRVGLVAYGHRREGDCSDIELVTPLGALDRAALKSTVNALQPKGKTPITRSLQQAFEVVGGGEGAAVILVSDGLETCDADPCAAVRTAKESGVEFVLHVVGFDVAGEDVSSLECSAQAGGGFFFSAENADQLASALETAVALPPEEPAGGLRIKVVKDGALHDASIRVTDRVTGVDINGSRTYEKPETNPRRLPLPAGDYSVRVRGLGIKGAADHVFDVTLAEGEVVEREFDYTAGSLRVGSRRNGELSDTTYKVFPTGTREEVARGRTYTSDTSNPKTFEITPGTYDVEVKALEMSGTVLLRQERVVVEPQRETAVDFDFASGTLRIGATLGGALADAIVSVVDAASGEAVDSARTYAHDKSNPKEFILEPGTYRVEVRPTREGERRQIEVTVEAGATVEQMVEL